MSSMGHQSSIVTCFWLYCAAGHVYSREHWALPPAVHVHTACQAPCHGPMLALLLGQYPRQQMNCEDTHIAAFGVFNFSTPEILSESICVPQALEKLAQEHPQAVLTGGGLMATLSYLDFFQTGVQRVAVSTAALMCRSIPHSSHGTLVDAVPLLTPLLQNSVRALQLQLCPKGHSRVLEVALTFTSWLPGSLRHS